MVPDSGGDEPARTESLSLGLKDKRSGLESLALQAVLGRGTLWVKLDTFDRTTGRQHGRRI